MFIDDKDYDKKTLQDECNSIKKSIIKALSEFRDLGVDEYCAEMWFKKMFIQGQFNRLKNFLNALIADEIISNTDRYAFISEATPTKIKLGDQSDLIEDFKEIIEYCICVQSEITYKIELSRFVSYRLIRSEEKTQKNKHEVDSLECVFKKNINYLKEKGVYYYDF